jgi:hypothetical protein
MQGLQSFALLWGWFTEDNKGDPPAPTPLCRKGGLADPNLEPLDLQIKNIQKPKLGKTSRIFDRHRAEAIWPTWALWEPQR